MSAWHADDHPVGPALAVRPPARGPVLLPVRGRDPDARPAGTQPAGTRTANACTADTHTADTHTAITRTANACTANACTADTRTADGWHGLRWDAGRWEDDPRSQPADPPGAWREHWAGHSHVLHLGGADDNAAVYLDRDMDRAAGPRILPYVAEIWQYAKRTYGEFGTDSMLYAIFHGSRVPVCPAATYLDASHDWHNMVDVGGPWRGDAADVLDLVTHQVAHVVERASNGIAESPALPIWGSRTWAEFFTFDTYLALDRRAQAMALAERRWTHTDPFPRPDTNWFRDWFHPLWTGAGGAQVMVRFFRLLAEHFPRADDDSYRRFMTWGEYIHFTSGAANGDLAGLARAAFGWPTRWTFELERARSDFPRITY